MWSFCKLPEVDRTSKGEFCRVSSSDVFWFVQNASSIRCAKADLEVAPKPFQMAHCY